MPVGDRLCKRALKLVTANKINNINVGADASFGGSSCAWGRANKIFLTVGGTFEKSVWCARDSISL